MKVVAPLVIACSSALSITRSPATDGVVDVPPNSIPPHGDDTVSAAVDDDIVPLGGVGEDMINSPTINVSGKPELDIELPVPIVTRPSPDPIAVHPPELVSIRTYHCYRY